MMAKDPVRIKELCKRTDILWSTDNLWECYRAWRVSCGAPVLFHNKALCSQGRDQFCDSVKLHDCSWNPCQCSVRLWCSPHIPSFLLKSTALSTSLERSRSIALRSKANSQSLARVALSTMRPSKQRWQTCRGGCRLSPSI